MKLSKTMMKQIITLMAVAALMVLAVVYCGDILKAVGACIKIVTPFIVGGAIAFILNIPMSAIERKWFGKWNGAKADRFKRPASLVLTLVLVFATIALLFVLVVPSFTETVREVAKQMPAFLDEASKTVKNWNIPGIGKLSKQGEILDMLSKNWEKITETFMQFMQNGASDVIGNTMHIVTSIVGGIVSGIIGFVFAIYILVQKEKLADQFKRLFRAYLPEKKYNKLMNLLVLLDKNFSSFITGQCLDACILGTLFVITMFILRIPYALMIGVLIAFTALIPIVGAFIGCFVGTFLILMAAPHKVVWFLILFIVLQQTEGKLIYPRVVGGSVGLPAIWVLFAVFTGGSLFGAVGMLVFIPLVSTIYTLLREDVNRRNLKKA